jgi:hypothetical protein
MAAVLSHLREGEAVAATGLVVLLDGAPAVVVDEKGGLVRVGSLGQALPIAGQGTDAFATAAPSGAPESLQAGAGPLGTDMAPTSLLALVALTLLSVVATVIRRRLVRRRLRLAVVQRLAGLRPNGGPSVAP